MFFQHRKDLQAHFMEHIPSYIKKEYPLFIRLLELFAEFMEKENNPLYRLEHLQDHQNPTSPYNRFWEEIYEEMGFPYSNDLKIDKRAFYNYLYDFYHWRGSVQGLKFLFAVLYKEDIQVLFPRDEMFIPSSADYVRNQYMTVKLRKLDSNLLQRLKNGLQDFDVAIKSSSSKETLDVENIFPVEHGKDVFLILKVNLKPHNKFLAGEQMTLFGEDFSYTVINCPLVSLTVRKKGHGYKVGDQLTFTNCVTQGRIEVGKVSKGSVEKVNIKMAGANYKKGEKIIAQRNDDNTGGGFYAEITDVDPATGAITSVEVLNKGYDYKTLPQLVILSKEGSNGVIEPLSETIGGIEEFNYIYPYAIDLTETNLKDISTTIHARAGARGFVVSLVPVVAQEDVPYYRTWQGVLDNTSVLTDSLYWQQFCYQISSSIPRYIYDDLVDEMSHPAGYVRYAGYKMVNVKHDFKTKFKAKVERIVN